MTRDEIVALAYILYREKSTNTSIAAASDMLTLVNAGYTQLMGEVWPDIIDTSTSYSIPLTTVASKTSNTVWVLTSATGFTTNTDLCIWTGSRFDTGRISTIVSNTVTLTSPGIVYAHTTGAYASPMSLTVTDNRFLRSAIFQVATTTDNKTSEILPVTHDDMFRLGFVPGGSGIPSKYSPWVNPTTEIRFNTPTDEAGYVNIIYGAKNAYTLAETSSSPIIDTDAHIGIVYWVLAMLNMRERNFQAAREYMQMYQMIVIKTRSAIVSRKINQSKFSLKKGSL